MVYKHILPIMACGLACATESFESSPAGETGELSTMYGCLSGDALISTGAARSGKQFLRIKGAKNRCVKITFTEPLADVAVLNFWVQRWTAQGAFHLQVVAETPGGNVVVQKNIAAVVKEYKQAQAVLPAGTTGVKLICSSIEGGGALVDDVELFVGPMQVAVADCEDAGPQPMLKRAPINPVFSYKLQTQGAANPLAVEAVKLKVSPANAVSAVTIRSGQADRSVDGTIGLKFRTGKTGKVYGTATPAADGTVTVPCNGTLAPGDTELWVDATPAAHVPVGSKITFEPGGVVVGGKLYAEQGPAITRRVGYLLAVPDATVTTKTEGERPCVTYRIPGMIRTAKGTLLACFDARY
ncbi:MAG: hypothetical protein IKC90_00495, partial [Akkermansia sp.]|nr:hypothetical protein [Akkermansia sp.]